MITEDHDYEKTSSGSSSQKGSAMDDILFSMLKKLRKNIAKEKSLPPAIIFQESSLLDMSQQLPYYIRRNVSNTRSWNRKS